MFSIVLFFDIQTNLNWEHRPALFSVSKHTQTQKHNWGVCLVFFCLHAHTYPHTYSTSLLSSLCSLHRSILLFQLKSLLEVSYSVRHTMQICGRRRAFGPGNYQNLHKRLIIKKHQATEHLGGIKKVTRGSKKSFFGVYWWYDARTKMCCYQKWTQYSNKTILLDKIP